RLGGVIVIAGATPVPFSVIVCGLPVALSVMESVAERVPVADGVKVTFTVVLLPAVTVIGGALPVKGKWVALRPPIPRLETTRSALPLLVSVIGICALVLLIS